MYLEEDERALEEVYPQGEKVQSAFAFIMELHRSYKSARHVASYFELTT
jgi:hypothetical protein